MYLVVCRRRYRHSAGEGLASTGNRIHMFRIRGGCRTSVGVSRRSIGSHSERVEKCKGRCLLTRSSEDQFISSISLAILSSSAMVCRPLYRPQADGRRDGSRHSAGGASLCNGLLLECDDCFSRLL